MNQILDKNYMKKNLNLVKVNLDPPLSYDMRFWPTFFFLNSRIYLV